MTTLSRAIPRLAAGLVPALLLSAGASAATPPAAAAAILPVPLQPVVPEVQRACTQKTASGLGYTQLKPGQGGKPAATDFVLVNYIGYLAASGAVFDQDQRSAFPVDGVVKGFGEGLQLMDKGAIYRFCIPGALGYGEKGAGPIPANADLVFQVELVDYKTAAEVEAMRKAQAEAEAKGDQSAPPPAANTPGK
ncbi:MAG: FKBP-type peptidyl-prolyl cis-trans isomerase [Sphingomonadales bacterium]|nr:FKBP-type peptidyl-prolyl cis-trans isomerase [Sphingomonadales bacterium]MDE2568172.1 FKBP-type peptidyl-prolyl cis-trans isomerase [Sphingomonadales bacterium]